MSSVVVQNSTFLDDFGNNQATPQQFAQLASSTSENVYLDDHSYR